MAVQIGARPEHGFDEPLGLLSDCHRRIEHFLGVLERVVDAARGDFTDEQRRAAETALTYFDQAAPRHTQDEEESLFPLLRRMDRPEVQAALEKLAALEADHVAAGELHARVRADLREWLDQGPLEAQRHGELRRMLSELRAMYQRHIAVEDLEIFPLAARVLSRDRLDQVGREMAARRGLVR